MIVPKCVVFMVLLLLTLWCGSGFTSSHATVRRRRSSSSRTPLVLFSQEGEENFRKEAERLLEKANELRSSIEDSSSSDGQISNRKTEVAPVVSEWNTDTSEIDSCGFRLYLDIGREDGTWMDPRWGASGRRIELSLDVAFTNVPADKEAKEKMVKDNFGGKSSQVYGLVSAKAARLRGGFDRMKTHGGAYRTDASQSGMTVRFYLQVDGTPERGSSYGDIFIPKGRLYFSLPCFNGVSQLSSKEGIVTVRQVGWHTGWRREESRIVGTFYAVPIEKAKRLDKF